MSSVNITRDEALARSEEITTHSYHAIVDLTGRGVDGATLANPDENFTVTTTVRFSSTQTHTWIDVIADEIVGAWLDGNQLATDSYDGARLWMDLDEGEHQLTITATPRYSRTGEGLHRFVDPADGNIYLYSQFETADARRMFACFDQPNLKATHEFTVIGPQDWVVFSNSPTPEPSVDGDFYRWEFAATPPIPTYITAVVAGHFAVRDGTITSMKGEIPAAFACRASMIDYLEDEQMRATTQAGFTIYEEYFNREFPFEKYDQIFLPEYNAGAMENAGCVTFRDEYLFRSQVTANEYSNRDNTILHELAHMWFGDLVTMSWWDDLWLNESFAEWASTWCQTERARREGGENAWTTFANRRKLWAYRTDQLPTTHPVAADMIDLETVDQNFDGITYAKGASVLKQLVAYVGEDAFFAGVQNYFAAHEWGNTTFDDLVSALEESSGRDLSQFTSQWLESSGVNVLTPQITLGDDGTYERVIVEQTAVGEHVARTHRIAVGLYDLRGQTLELRECFEVDITGDETDLPQLTGVAQPDLLLLNDADLSYVKIRMDDRSLRTARAHLGRIADPLARAVAWTSLWDTWRDAEMSSEVYLDAVLTGLAGEDHPTAVINQIQQTALATTSYCAPSRRAEQQAVLSSSLASLLKTATPGTDRQLALVDGLIASVSSPAGAALLKAWLSGDEVPPSVTIDADRRWNIVTSLARMGHITSDEIDDEAHADNTITGAERAAGALAALYDADAKERAWTIATEASVPNATHLEVAARFWQFGQEDILAPYVARYLELLDDMHAGQWADRGHVARQTALTYLWPTPFADRQFIDTVHAWLKANQPTEQIRRILVDRCDASARALAVASL